MSENFITDIVDSILENKFHRKIAFIHVPKCGGLSINNALLRQCGFWNRLRRKGIGRIFAAETKKGSEILNIPLQKYRREVLTYYLCNPYMFYVNGHVSVSDKIMDTFSKEWNFITLLRDPVDRWYSEYNYNRYKGFGHFQTDLELAKYVDSERGVECANTYINHFAGDYSNKKDGLSKAKRNLKKFMVVGFLDNMKDFENKMKSTLNIELKVPHKNENPAPKQVRQNIPDEIHQKVLEICKTDIEFYMWAKNQY